MITSRGNVDFKLNHEVLRVVSRHSKSSSGPIELEFKVAAEMLETAPMTAHFDQLILAIDADSCLKLLRNEATFMEKRVLGNVKYLYDVTITHNDVDYMKKVRLPCCLLDASASCPAGSFMRLSTTRLITPQFHPRHPPRSVSRRRMHSSSRRRTLGLSIIPCNIPKTGQKSR